jgi:Co/Zn/Cd efflux system component
VSKDCAPTIERRTRISRFDNGGMFLTEIVAGLAAGSAALQADGVDFLSDAGNYGLALVWRARAALVKGVSMGLLGLWVAGNTLWHAVMGTLPAAEVMGVVGVLALLVNGGVTFLLYRNMRSVWICSRNDTLGNVAVMLAALGVFGTGTGWPDIIVASIMAVLSLGGAGQIINHAWNELRTGEGQGALLRSGRIGAVMPAPESAMA